MIFPHNAFTQWVRNGRKKSQRECKVLYIVLALGSIFAEDQYSSFAKHCVEKARHTVSAIVGDFSTLTIHARLLLANYYRLVGEDNMGWELSGLAFTAIGAMRLYHEDGYENLTDDSPQHFYGFSCEQLKECRRRTFWTALLVDRGQGLCRLVPCTMQLDLVRLRLPCNEQLYERGELSDVPVFDCALPNMGMPFVIESPTMAGPEACTVVVAALCTDVIALVHRQSHRPAELESESREAMIREVKVKLSEWGNNLPHHLRYSQQNLLRADQHGYARWFIDMHVFHHVSQIKASRALYFPSHQPIERQNCNTRLHAIRLLDMVCGLSELTLRGLLKDRDPTTLISSLLAYGIKVAIDVLYVGSAVTYTEHTVILIEHGVVALNNLAQSCAVGKVLGEHASAQLADVRARADHSFK
ncbi:hypothetical protein D6D13_10614 [Aureobasidium pullulans]|uniref:Xylanolytic transcriptional activator regulatory domain-containing protein n=1 Tax=Aureobasidium pullulans TaxID=5580 RepID=A0A4S9BX33_AURPU|nr:hypothetical protein D6D13_10614 [Aureobasidium pullulans]